MKLEELFSPTYLDEVLVWEHGQTFKLLREGKWIAGRFDSNIRIDQPTHLHGDGEPHAHVLGRKGDELGVVNYDGTGSHGSKFKLHDRDAVALRAQGFNVRADKLVEWTLVDNAPGFLLE